MLVPDNVKVPDPAFVSVTPVPVIAPATLPTPELVIERAELSLRPKAAAVKSPEVILRPVSFKPLEIELLIPIESCEYV